MFFASLFHTVFCDYRGINVSILSSHLCHFFSSPIQIIYFPLLCLVYAFMSEHLDLRHVMGVGIAITRGSAAALSFNYCLLLLTMCRNLITKMKEHSLHQ